MLGDITERKRAEEALVRSEALRRIILDSLHVHVAVINATGDILAVNEPWRRFAMENAVQEISSVAEGVNYLEVVRKAAETGDRLAEGILQGIQDVLTEKRPTFEADYPCDSPTEQRWFHMQIARLEGGQGGAVLTHENITKRKQTEEAGRESERKYRQLVEVIQEGIWVIDKYSITTFVNPCMAKILGYNEEEMLGRHLFSFMDEQGVEIGKAILMRVEQAKKDKNKY